MRRISPEGLALIQRWEGCELTAYRDPVGILTIGYGSTGPHVKPGMTITQAEADQLLRDDLDRFELAIEAMVKVPLTDGQFAALVSLAFNIGIGAFKNSTLLKRLNAGDYTGAQQQFAAWRKAGGKVLAGLVNRRAAEAALFGRGEFVSSNTVEPDEPPSERVTTSLQNTGAATTAVGTAGTVITESAQQMNLVSQGSNVIQLVCALLMLAGVGLVVWSIIRRSKA